MFSSNQRDCAILSGSYREGPRCFIFTKVKGQGFIQPSPFNLNLNVSIEFSIGNQIEWKRGFIHISGSRSVELKCCGKACHWLGQ